MENLELHVGKKLFPKNLRNSMKQVHEKRRQHWRQSQPGNMEKNLFT